MRVVVIQRIVPHYRIQLFERLFEELGWVVAAARAPPSHGFNTSPDREFPWLFRFDFRLDRRRQYAAKVPVKEIIARLNPEGILAEFSLQMSSTWRLSSRSRGRRPALAYWSQGWNVERGFRTPVDLASQAARLVLMARADAQLCYSEAGAQYLRRWMPREQPVFVAPNTLPLDELPERFEDTSSRDPSAAELLYIGRLTPDKRVPVLLEAFSKLSSALPNVRLRIVGDGPEMNKVAALAASIPGRVEILGEQYDQIEIARLMHRSTLYVSAGSAGLGINHALAYGLPAVIFDNPGSIGHHPEHSYVIDGETGFRVSHDGATALSECLFTLLNRPVSPKILLAKSIRDFVDQHMNFENMLGGFRELDSFFERQKSSVAAVRREPVRFRNELTSTLRAGSLSGNAIRPAVNSSPSKLKGVTLVWEQFAAYHLDRCDALARALGMEARVTAIELATFSDTYSWEPPLQPASINAVTLFPGRNANRLAGIRIFSRLVLSLIKSRSNVIFINGYEKPSHFFAAILMRLMGRRVFVMNDSKFDDKRRILMKEMFKIVLMLPYNGALASGRRASEYFSFLGFPDHLIAEGYDTVSLERLRLLASGCRPSNWEERPFLVVARLVEKKNLSLAVAAYAEFRHRRPESGRRLRICGSGPLLAELQRQARQSGIHDHVDFLGAVTQGQVATEMAGALCLMLPSHEEQWGLVINEALAFALPVLVGTNVGALDSLASTMSNGFVLDPGDPQVWAEAMDLISSDPTLWSRFHDASKLLAPRADVAAFAAGCLELIGRH